MCAGHDVNLASENLVIANCNGKEYFYVRYILCNIIKIIDEGNVYVVVYEYGAKLIINTITLVARGSFLSIILKGE